MNYLLCFLVRNWNEKQLNAYDSYFAPAGSISCRVSPDKIVRFETRKPLRRLGILLDYDTVVDAGDLRSQGEGSVRMLVLVK
jgi:hypothetical protein